MAPRKRRGLGRVSGVTLPPTSTHAVNTRGFAALADEIYLEIVSHIPSVPIPTGPGPAHLLSYPGIRRSRHETFLSLSQTSRSLRRFFWRYLWQQIEVREGMRVGDKDDTVKGTRTRTRTTYLSYSWDKTGYKNYAVELVRQLEIVTVRNPQLAQYVNYLDIFIGQHSIETVLAELARCLSLFSNLHTVQIDADSGYRRRRYFGDIFEQAFKKYSYPQIRNVFVDYCSVCFIASCPQARHVGFARCSIHISWLQTPLNNCPHLEVLDDFGDFFWRSDDCKLVVNNFPNLRSIQFMIFPLATGGNPSNINILTNLNHLQTIIMKTPSPNSWHMLPHEKRALIDRVTEDWIESAKRVLIHIQLGDNLEKTVVVGDYEGNERRILIQPKSSSFALSALA